MLVNHLYVLFGEGSIQVLFPCKNLGCLQGLAAPPGPSQVLQTVLLAALVSVSPACGAEGGGSSGTRASLAALQGRSFLPGACRRGDSRPQAPSAAPRGRGLCEAAFAHLGTAATPACLSRKWASVRSAPGWAHWLRFTWALQGRPRAASGCGRPGRGPLAWVRIGGHLARLLPAPRLRAPRGPLRWSRGPRAAGPGPPPRAPRLRGALAALSPRDTRPLNRVLRAVAWRLPRAAGARRPCGGAGPLVGACPASSRPARS